MRLGAVALKLHGSRGAFPLETEWKNALNNRRSKAPRRGFWSSCLPVCLMGTGLENDLAKLRRFIMTYDFAPLFRTAIGFDRLARLVDTLPQDATGYPPYNIEKTGEESYRLTLAVAGFAANDIELTVKDNALVVTGSVAEETSKNEFLHRGIASRAFTRRFALADHMVVEGADIANGLLHVTIKRLVPESAKPRRIAINNVGTAPKTIDQPEVPKAA
jgi:molecular chaperone IbpA